MPLSDGYREETFWRAGLELPGPYIDRPLPREADVVVIGSGFTGLSAALELARRARAVTVLEKEELGFGASSRNGGMVHGGLKRQPDWLLRRRGERGVALHRASMEAYDAVVALIREEGIDCDLEEHGSLTLAWKASQVERMRRMAAEDGRTFVPRERLDEEIGTRFYHAGLIAEHGGGLNPAKYHAGLARLAERAGADLHEFTPAEEIARRAGGGFDVSTPRGTVACGDVLLATNGYTDRIAPWHRRHVVPIGSYIIVTEPLEPALAEELSPKRRTFYDWKNFLFYWRLTADDRMAFGGRASFRPTTIARTRDVLYRSMIQVHPQLAGIRVEFAWGGNVAFTFDRLPHIGKHDGITHAMGYSGVGVIMASHLGRVAGGWLAGDPEPEFANLPWPPPPAKPYSGNPWFLPFAGMYYGVRDRLGRTTPRP